MFFSIFFPIYFLLNAYIFFRGFAALPGRRWWVIGLKILFVLLAVSFPFLHSLEDKGSGVVFQVLTVVGSLWTAAMLYFFLIVLFSDIVRIVDYFAHIIPERIKKSRALSAPTLFFGSIALVSVIIFSGWLNTLFVRVENVEVSLANLPKVNNPTTIVFAADLHISATTREEKVSSFVDSINAQHPDVILLGGDLVEGSVDGLGRFSSILAGLKAPLGVFAVFGNHEFHGDQEKTGAFMRSAGIRELRNEVVTLPGRVNIVGLDDPGSMHAEVKVSPLLPGLLKKRDASLPTILLYHRPVNLEAYAAYPIDLMLAGHTHHGQLFPITLVTDLVYEVSYGYKKIGPMRLYVTSGLGTWGPPVRVLTHPEIVRVTLVNHGEN